MSAIGTKRTSARDGTTSAFHPSPNICTKPHHHRFQQMGFALPSAVA